MMSITVNNLVAMALYVGVMTMCRLMFESPKFPVYLFLCGFICLLSAPGFVIGLTATIMVPIGAIIGDGDNEVVLRPWVRRIIDLWKTSKLRKFLLK